MPNTYPVTLCALSSQYLHVTPAPYALLAGVRTFCTQSVDCQVVQGTVNEPVEAVADRIAATSPRLVGLSCYIWNISRVKELLPLLRQRLPDAYILLGGPEVTSHSAARLAELPDAHGILCGEGEWAFAAFCDALAAEQPLENIASLTCRLSDGSIREGTPCVSMQDPPSLCIPEYLSAARDRIAYLETGRGCPYRCAFCLSGQCGTARWFDVERAKQDLLALAAARPRVLKLVDRTFNAHRNRAEDLLRFILQEQGKGIPSGLCIHFEVAADLLSDEMIALLRQMPAGAVQLEVGLQSFSEVTLAAVRRRTDLNTVVRRVQQVLESGNVHLHLDLIAGLPYEDLETFTAGFHRAFALRPHMLQLGFLKLLLGAAMREEPEAYPCRFRAEAPYEVIDTPWISAADLARLHRAETALDKLYNSGRFRNTVEYVLQASALTPMEPFEAVGNAAAGQGSLSLEAYTALVQETLAALPGIDAACLRDALVQDTLATRGEGRLPACLQHPDPQLRRAKIALEADPVTRSRKGVRRGVALLYGARRTVYVDYDAPRDPVTGRFPLHNAPFPEHKE
jgi:hypothetical protein